MPRNCRMVSFCEKTGMSMHYLVTTSLHYCIAALRHQCITAFLHHHIRSSPPHWYESFDLPLLPHYHVAAWDFPHHIGMNHLTCPYHCVTASLCHCITTSLHYHVTMWDFAHHIGMNHLTCPYHHVIASLHYCITALQHYHITTLPHYHITTSLLEIFPTTLVWIWLINATQHSSDWLMVPATANQIISI